jgi:hypothetical protein
VCFCVQSSDSEKTSCLSVLIDVLTSGIIRIQTPDQVLSETSEGVQTWGQVSSKCLCKCIII